ncbi:MAG: hypothetical protein PHG79_02530 [Methanosarcina sp.]|jgi:hypothetical protein|nr:hypothetical protein [Methanosarcina sp.]MDD3873474.1 hypothetical protein [Methanosarcina sp.]MDD4521609.1 hypothetical protein [Methanosarcina sp.]
MTKELSQITQVTFGEEKIHHDIYQIRLEDSLLTVFRFSPEDDRWEMGAVNCTIKSYSAKIYPLVIG